MALERSKGCHLHEHHGFSLLELVISLAITSAGFMAASQFMVLASREQAGAFSRHSSQTELSFISGYLQKTFGSGDIRFFGFSGKQTTNMTGPGYDRLTGRFIVPLGGQCRDLSSNCPHDNAVMYVHYDKTTAPAVSVGAAAFPSLISGAAADDLSGDSLFVIDLNNSTYGQPQFTPGAAPYPLAVVNTPGAPFPNGPLALKKGSVFSVLAPPNANLWVATDAPRAATPAEAAKLGAGTLSPLIAVGGAQSYVVLPAQPLVMADYTGGVRANVPVNPDPLFGGGPPLRLLPVQLRIIGRMPDHTVAIRDCAVDPAAATQISCLSPDILPIHNVQQFWIEEAYNFQLNSAGTSRFEMVGSTMTQSPSCVAPACGNLPLPQPLSYLVLTSPTEAYTSLDPSIFSFIKEEVLSAVRFHLVLDPNPKAGQPNAKEETFDAFFL